MLKKLLTVFLLITVTLSAGGGPSNPTLKAELIEMAKADQAARLKWLETRDSADKEKYLALDKQNTLKIREVVKQYGWPGYALVDEEGSHAAWLIVQHASDRAFKKEALTLLEEAVNRADAAPLDLAYLKDKIAIQEDRSQIYGTQFQFEKEGISFYPIEDIENIDARRSALGLSSLAEYAQQTSKLFGLPFIFPAEAVKKGTIELDVTAVQLLMAESVKSATKNILQAVMEGVKAKINFQQLAAQHTQADLMAVLAADQKLQPVYQKLLAAVKEHINAHSTPLAAVLAMINKQTGQETAAELFVGSFVLPEAKALVERLQKSYPQALENSSLWQ